MRKNIYSLFFVSLLLVSCIETQKSQIEKQAIETFKSSFITIGEDSKDAQFENIKTVFTSKNLCILNADISGVKGINKVEYLFLTQDDKKYEAFQDLNEDSVFVSESTFNKICKGTIYENQDYATAILFRSVIYMNYNGREVGNHNTDFFINSPLKTGAWEVCGTADEFGDITDGKCLRLFGKGTYSTEYENDKKLVALLFVNNNGYTYLKLLKKGSRLVDDFSGHIKIKDGENDVHDIYFSQDHPGAIVPYCDKKDVFHGEGKLEFRKILDKEGVLSALADIGGGLFDSSPKCKYKFKFYIEGFKKAMSILQSKKNNANQYDESDYDDREFDIDNSESDDSEPVSDEEIEAIKESIKFETESEPVNEELESDKKTNNNTDDDFPGYTEPPYFIGGNIFEWLNNHLRYPEKAMELGIQGRVIVSFVIEKDGSISNVTVAQTSGKELNDEAVRLVKLMEWRPAKLNDKFVRSKYTVPINFRLQ